VLDEACLHRARMRDGRLHLDEAVREGGRCTARSASVSLVASETALAAGRYTISELRLPFVLLRGLGPQIAPWNPGLDHEDWPDVFLPKDHPTVGEVLDLVYPEGWEIVAARHVNTRVQPLGTTRRDVEQGPYLDDALRHSLSEVYRQRLQGEVTLVDMRGRVSKIMEMLEARASKGHASAPGQQVEPR
ncbi:MAG: hypothetical protein KC656_26910, partial [Myxococcales bacterium]|nr:hypothetical protein [Myxococcales bacterium]